MSNTDEPFTHFGYQQVKTAEKADKVADVFHSVAPNYDLMNDLMSLGIHRLWKRITALLTNLKPGQKVLDIAGGTGDLAKLLANKVGETGQVILADINSSMLEHGRQRLHDVGLLKTIEYVQANAECLPFEENQFDCITIGFGLRNVTDKAKALRSMHRCLKPGGQLFILEFSEVKQPWLKPIYDLYSFQVLPRLGQLFAGDADSYQYLAESIRMHPNQETLEQMLQQAGFSRCQYHNFCGGIVALHRGYKI